ncbi:FAD-binding oxidoreductase [Aliiroseovarius subalbicans]|uniref:FAD-binding oxidoreductase n=1 Tax=Aliiroseovarius subalbicans TaxID=2925840 RepID=UPI001F5A4D7E|nr:FAD-binding oxidoreductase [Aliiroseovarius subalbicans]MCI2398907.1 FAD-binding oxidoreductase [Aliiroseovarius subalbicans]
MPDLNPANRAFETSLRSQLPEAAFRALTPAYLEEPRGLFHGQDGLLIAPGSTEEVAQVVRACAAARVGIVPYGGGTGLVGGQVMPDGPAPVILSLERMKKIRAVYPQENAFVAEAGAVLSEVQTAAEDAKRLFPLSLASEGSCRVGGVLSTNAGGVNVLRYGNARDLCLGLEAVLPDGSIWHGLKRLRKDNTGYDLRHLLCGAEGTLGVITAASLKLFPRPMSVGTALLVVPNPEAALALLALAHARLGQAVSAFELISGAGMGFLAETGCPARAPFPDLPDWAVLVELGLGQGHDADAELEGLFTAALGAGLAHDGVIAQSDAQRAGLWRMREEIPEANRRLGAISSHDISLPLSVIPEFLIRAGDLVAGLGPYRVNAFGHLGDGNLHYNIFPPKGAKPTDFPDARAQVASAVYDLVQDYDGSFSAEHGVGRLKAGDLERFADPAKLAAMRAIKAALDPQGIMNPGAVLRT